MKTLSPVMVRFPSLTAYQRYISICGASTDCRLARGGSVVCHIRNTADMLCCAVDCGATFNTRRGPHD